MSPLRIVLSQIVPPLLFVAVAVATTWTYGFDADMLRKIVWAYGVVLAWLTLSTIIWRITPLRTDKPRRAGSLILIATGLQFLAAFAMWLWQQQWADDQIGVVETLKEVGMFWLTGAVISALSALIAGVPFRKARALSA